MSKEETKLKEMDENILKAVAEELLEKYTAVFEELAK